MANADYRPVNLWGGALTCALPTTFIDASDLRQVPDHQEVWLDTAGFTSIVFDVLERVEKPTDREALLFHLRDLVDDDDDEDDDEDGAKKGGETKVWRTGEAQLAKLGPNVPAYTLFATTPASVTKHHGRDRAKEPDFVGILLTVIRLTEQNTDVLITINVPHIPGTYDTADVDLATGKYGKLLEQAVAYREKVMETLEVKDWGLFVQGE